LLEARQLKLFGDIQAIYPIQPVIKSQTPSQGAANTSNSVEDLYTIRGVELPQFIDTRYSHVYICRIPTL
jgi:hypothetical protein